MSKSTWCVVKSWWTQREFAAAEFRLLSNQYTKCQRQLSRTVISIHFSASGIPRLRNSGPCIFRLNILFQAPWVTQRERVNGCGSRISFSSCAFAFFSLASLLLSPHPPSFLSVHCAAVPRREHTQLSTKKILERLARMGFETMGIFIWSSFFGLIGAKNYYRMPWRIELKKGK